MNDEEAIRKAFEALRSTVDLAYSRWVATGHIDDEVRNLMELPVRRRDCGPFATFTEALSAQTRDAAVMRAICLYYLGEPGSPWDYECVLAIGQPPIMYLKGYMGMTKSNIIDIRDTRPRLGLEARRRRDDFDFSDSGHGF